MSTVEFQKLAEKVASLEEWKANANVDDDKWMDLKDVADYTTLSRRTINRAIAEKQVKVSRQVGKNLFRKSWVDAWLTSRQSVTPSETSFIDEHMKEFSESQ